MRDPAPKSVRTRTVALAGNPNSGKTTVFNALTGRFAQIPIQEMILSLPPMTDLGYLA